MRLLTGRLLNSRLHSGKFLEIGVALCLLAARPALAADEVVMQVAQNGSPAAEQPAPGPIVPAPAPAPAPAASGGQDLQPGYGQPAAPQVSAEIPKPFHGSVSFEAGSGKILTLLVPAANIYVADPKVAEVRPASSTSLFVFGVGPGHTTIAAVDQLGRLLADYDVMVRPSAFGSREAQSAITRLIPGSRVQVKASGKGMMLTGAVATAADAAQAVLIAKGFADGAAVDNQMTIASPTQVTLMVRIAEMKRSTARNIGINWSANGLLGTAPGAKSAIPGTSTASTLTPLISGTLNGAACAVGGAASGGRLCFDSVLNALATEGLAHILAEPNLTVMSGQAASFQAGG
jgi:pilus assembly protein CpaC